MQHTLRPLETGERSRHEASQVPPTGCALEDAHLSESGSDPDTAPNQPFRGFFTGH
jgi:hypothetical protein